MRIQRVITPSPERAVIFAATGLGIVATFSEATRAAAAPMAVAS